MALRLWWWTKVRKANIPEDTRNLFERYGEAVIAHALATSYAGSDASSLSGLVFQRSGDAVKWLTERRDKAAQREDRLETVEWAILIAVVVSVGVDIALLYRG
jgi:hypothetical protein